LKSNSLAGPHVQRNSEGKTTQAVKPINFEEIEDAEEQVIN
jgi:hypothetical protein